MSPHPEEPRGAGPAPLPGNPGPAEFEDEGPGSYLAELGTRTESVVWGCINFAAIAGLGLWASLSRPAPENPWFIPARLVWSILPVSAVLLLVVTLWQLGTPYTPKHPARIIISILSALCGLGVWLYFTFSAGVLA